MFVNSWKKRKSLKVSSGRPITSKSWISDISLKSLIYKLIDWIPNMQSDIEGLVYLEVITRTIDQAALFSPYESKIFFNAQEESSIKELYWNVFLPIATGSISINEDLLETLPNDRLSIMSIHQSKGLEFPLTIVDVGSDFKNNSVSHAFKRFPHPNKIGETYNIEDELRNFSPVGPPTRRALDRAFDDLIRQFFVAYSRAMDVLLLVGLNPVKQGKVKNIATGWDRNGNWHWRNLENIIHI
jgi:DNA helicase-2/ATP-dependent DNA helicase PcrA